MNTWKPLSLNLKPFNSKCLSFSRTDFSSSEISITHKIPINGILYLILLTLEQQHFAVCRQIMYGWETLMCHFGELIVRSILLRFSIKAEVSNTNKSPKMKRNDRFFSYLIGPLSNEIKAFCFKGKTLTGKWTIKVH